jgi:hypothetical protein
MKSTKFRSDTWPEGLTVTAVDSEAELWAIEEPPEPVITVTYDGSSWVVYGDENADHPDYGEKWWPAVLYGGGRYEDEAKAYAKQWAKAVRGCYEII